MRRALVWPGVLILVVAACSQSQPQEVADVLYTGGVILTMTDTQPEAEALAVKGGKILAVGSRAEIEKAHRGKVTRIVDLGGKALLPGFIDGHSHFLQAGLTPEYVNVSPEPVGPVSEIKDIQEAVRAHIAKHDLQPGDWVIGYGYDYSVLPDKQGATFDDLEEFEAYPLALIHVSGHGALLNRKAFGMVDFGDLEVVDTYPGTEEPTGLVMEDAFIEFLHVLPQPTEEELLKAIAVAQQEYARNGYTTVQDAPVGKKIRAFYKSAADAGHFYLDLIAYADDCKSTESPAAFDADGNHYRMAGVKVILDGSPQGRTALFLEPYLPAEGDGGKENLGQSLIEQKDLNAIVQCAYDRGWQVLAHANGDGAVQMLLEAHEHAGKPEGKRTVPVHSQFVNREQLAKYVEYGFVPSFFTNHAFYWGDVHVQNLGEKRAFFMSPLKTARAMGLHMTNHSDFLVTPLDPMHILWTAVHRTSRSGVVIGKDERVSPAEGLLALTIDGAYQYSEEDTRGSLEPGKLADLVILSEDPRTAADIRKIQVVETIKEGKTVYPLAR